MTLPGQSFQRFLIGAGLAVDGRLAVGAEALFLEQHLAQLLDRGDVELTARQLVNALFEIDQLPIHVRAEAVQIRHVEADAVEFHVGEHVDQRNLQVVVEAAQILQLRFQQLGQAPGDVGIFAGVLGHFVARHLIHAFLVLALADQIGDGNHLMLQMLLGQDLHAVDAFAGMQQIIGDHRIAGDAGQVDAVLAQHLHVVLDVLIDLGDAGIFEDRLQLGQRRGRVERRFSQRPTQGQVLRLAGLPGKGQAHDVGPARLQVRRFQIEGDALLLLETGEERGELLGGVDQMVVVLPIVGEA